ncbi:hypothetical protein D3C73_1360560 [compost metagenome]
MVAPGFHRVLLICADRFEDGIPEQVNLGFRCSIREYFGCPDRRRIGNNTPADLIGHHHLTIRCECQAGCLLIVSDPAGLNSV